MREKKLIAKEKKNEKMKQLKAKKMAARKKKLVVT